MFQQIIALIVILFFIARLGWQKKHNEIGNFEFLFWLVFWLLSGFIVVMIKYIDRLVAFLGFSGTGIQIIFYISIVVLFYFIFRIRLRQEKMEKNITKLVRHIALDEKK